MRIGIDGFGFAAPGGSGPATYGLVLADALAAAGHSVEGVFGVDPGRVPAIRESVFFDNLSRTEPPARAPHRQRNWERRVAVQALWPALRAVAVPLTDRVEKAAFADSLPAFDRLASRADLLAVAHRRFARTGRLLTLRVPDPPQVMHWTAPVPVRLAGARNIYTVHDLSALKAPEVSLEAKRSHHAMVSACLREAARVCVGSEATRADVLSFFSGDPARMTVVHQAGVIHIGATDPGADAVVRNVFGLERRGYFLCFGAKTDLGRLLKAYRDAAVATPLAMVGARAWADDLGDPIVPLPVLPRHLLTKLVRGARAVLLPSGYGEAGLQLLDAMQLGTPVLAAQQGALPELAGDAAVYADPSSTASFAEALVALDRDAALRERLATAGPVRAERFSRARYQAQLEQLYAAALAR